MRYKIIARGINVYKNDRSFKNINYVKSKITELREILDEDFTIIEVQDEVDMLRDQLQKANEVIKHVVYNSKDSTGLAYRYLENNNLLEEVIKWN